VENADITSSNPSTANLQQLGRAFDEVAALEPPPQFFFFAGDMVYGQVASTMSRTVVGNRAEGAGSR
jgi:hypothetical protein